MLPVGTRLDREDAGLAVARQLEGRASPLALVAVPKKVSGAGRRHRPASEVALPLITKRVHKKTIVTAQMPKATAAINHDLNLFKFFS